MIKSDKYGTTITGTEDVQMYAWMVCRRGLAFEIKTGMKMSRVSALQTAKRNGWTTKNTKAGALKEMNAHGAKFGIDPI